jgi:hypothetical protein
MDSSFWELYPKPGVTGLKHSVFNKLRLRGQGFDYDSNPCIMIVPVMTLNEVKAWDGAGYNALVMAGPREFTTDMGMLTRGPTATFEEIETARSMLHQVLCGLAHSLTHA